MPFKTAVVQAEPEYLDLEATVEKACNKIREAGEEDADLIAFGESFIPGYPWFIWMGPPSWWLPYQQQLYKNALTLPSDELDALAGAADEADAHVMMGATVRDGDSLYCSQVFINRDGEFEGVHHKLKPTFVERAVWGDGPGENYAGVRHRPRRGRRVLLLGEHDASQPIYELRTGRADSRERVPGLFDGTCW